MVIGVPKEIKDHEYRVSVTPDGVRALRQSRPRSLDRTIGRSRQRILR